MRITLKRQNKAVHLKAFNEEGASIDIDGAPAIGGENLGLRPMQLLLAGIGSCSTMDIINILRKQKQPIVDLEVLVDGQREKDKIPSLFETIHIHFILYGNLDNSKTQRAIDLSMRTYCSVTKILEKTSQITYSHEIITT